jgi:hypothetical protein
MALIFPSTEFFIALQKGLEDSATTQGIAPSDAYCGVMVDQHLFVLEFDGNQCSAVVPGGNPLDLDFVLAGSMHAWQQALGASAGESHTLDELLGKGELRIEAEMDDGEDLARAALPMLQAFVRQAAGIELELR